MAIPSNKYAEDTNARQTLANGTVLKWTKQLQNIHGLNVETDLSISYTNWANEPMMTHANRGFHQWQGGCVSGGDLGYNQSTGFGHLHATGIKQLESGQPRIDSLQSHVVLSNGGGYYVWGYNPEASTRISGSNGDQRRYLLDMDINKMIFTCTVTVVDKSFFDNVDFATNPENMPAPSEHNITLKELFTHPELYYCTGIINWSNTYVYGENTSDHWRGVAIRPAILLTGETIGEYQGADDSIFGRFTSSGNFSYDSRDPNGHATFGGGGSSNTLYNRMNSGYFMGCKNDMDMTPTDTFDSAGGAATAIALNRWGNTNFSRFAYCNGQIFDYGDSVIWCAWGTGVINNKDTGSRYKDYTFGTRRYIKADKMLKYIASFGLYFMSESFDPDSANLTPETLGDDNRIMLGEMSSDGTTTGRWITDIDSYHGPNKDGKTNNPTYDPSGGGGGADNPWDVDPETYGWSGGEVSGMVKYYLLTGGQMSSLQSAIASNANWTIDYLNCIVSCFVVPNSGIFFDAPIPTTVKFNLDNATKWDTGVACKRIQGTFNKSGGSIEIPRLTNTFLDFEPYSDYSVYIPFCGRVPIKGNVCLGREIKVTYYPDVPTCTLTAVVTCGGATIAIAKGSFGTMTPVTSNGSDRKTAAVIGDVAPIITGIGTGIVGVALGNPLIVGAGAAQALGGIMGGVKETVQSYAYSVGSTGDSSFFGAGNRCYYYANYPIIDDVVNNSMFGHSVGYLCNSVGKLSGFTGFTMCANPHVTFSASAEEREEIERLLSMGVIL